MGEVEQQNTNARILHDCIGGAQQRLHSCSNLHHVILSHIALRVTLHPNHAASPCFGFLPEGDLYHPMKSTFSVAAKHSLIITMTMQLLRTMQVPHCVVSHCFWTAKASQFTSQLGPHHNGFGTLGNSHHNRPAAMHSDNYAQ